MRDRSNMPNSMESCSGKKKKKSSFAAHTQHLALEIDVLSSEVSSLLNH